MSSSKEKFAARLKEAMKLRGMQQKELSEKTGIKPVMISFYCNGKNEPRDDKLTLISEVLQVNKAWLAGLTDDMGVLEDMRSIDNISFIFSGMILYDIKVGKKCRVLYINRKKKIITVLFAYRGKKQRYYIQFEENRFFIPVKHSIME